jgi:single-stranded-DNA-specific exonuclease
MTDFIKMLLEKRGITDPAAIDSFLNPNYELHTHSFKFLDGMDRAVARIFSAIRGSERIAIYADFDCDGIPGAAVLADFFAKIQYGNTEIYIPHRDREGYGFHEEAIKALAERGVTLIITVDVGTTAIDSVLYAKKLGVDVIVTDHHLPTPPSEASRQAGGILGSLPDAVAVLNPKLGEYPFRDLCGAAVAFKLVQALLAEGRRRGIAGFEGIPEGWEKWLLDLVGIATIADMVPLHGENRVLAHFGLAVLRKSPRPGIKALCNRLRLRQSELTEDDVGFSFAPRINAASRMDNPDLALHLLTTRDANEAERLAANLDQLNTSRKGIVGGVVRDAKKRVKERFNAEEKVVVLGNTEWKPSLLGLAANSIVEERGGIVCLWGRDAKGNLKGSCRSDGSISVVELFSGAGDAFLEFGGHNAAGGFSVSHERVHTLHEDLVRAAANLWKAGGQAVDESVSDARASLSEVTPRLFEEVSSLAPFGIGNLKPVFLVTGATVSAVRTFGRTKNHVEVLLSCVRTGATARAFDFFKTADSFSHAPQAGGNVNILATIERDSYRGGLALRIVDIIPAA